MSGFEAILLIEPAFMSIGITAKNHMDKNNATATTAVVSIMTFEFSGPNLNVSGNINAYVQAIPIPMNAENNVTIIS